MFLLVSIIKYPQQFQENTELWDNNSHESLKSFCRQLGQQQKLEFLQNLL